MKAKSRINKILLLAATVIFAGTWLASGNPVLDQIYDPDIACYDFNYLGCNCFGRS